MKYSKGITTGVFDLFHVGHLNLFERCKQQCDHLIVAVCDDEYVRKIKGKEPTILFEDRKRIVAALRCVDQVVDVTLEELEDKTLLLEKYKFDVLFSGDDWKGSERYNKTEAQFAQYGAKIEYLPYTTGISTSALQEKLETDK